MDTLPPEILEVIVRHLDFNEKDVLNITLTCNYLKELVYNSKTIWKYIIYNRFPQFKMIFKEIKSDWYSELKYICNVRKKTIDMIVAMPPEFYKYHSLSYGELKEWNKLIINNNTYCYVTDYLKDLTNNYAKILPSLTPRFSTLGSCALKVLTMLRHTNLIEQMCNMNKVKLNINSLEQYAALMEQWCHPNSERVSNEEICDRLYNLSLDVAGQLSTLYPEDEYLEHIDETLDEHEVNKAFRYYNCMHILNAIALVMLKNKSDKYTDSFRNSIINLNADNDGIKLN